MKTITPAFTLPFLRDIEVCPFAAGCRYAKVCEYDAPAVHPVTTSQQVQTAAVNVAQTGIGSAMLVVGVALSLTLFLIPVGVPLALLGVAFIGSTGDTTNRQT